MLEIAVIGAGHWGPNLIRNFDNRLRSRVRWIIDRDESRLEAAAKRFPDAQLGTDVEAVFADRTLDAVVVATPTDTHAALVRRALEVGLHVMVEKPLTADSVSARELSALAEEQGRVLLVGHVFVYNPAVRWVKQRMDAGELGRIYYISSARTNLGPIRTDVSASWDLAAQDIAIFNYWLDGPPISASARGHAWINPGLQDAVFATFRYPGDILVHLHVSWLNPRKVREITVVAEDKMLSYDDMDAMEPIRLFDKRVNVEEEFVDTFSGFRSVVHTGDITIPPVRMGEPLGAECMHFLDCIENGETPNTGGPEGVEVVRALEAMDRSMSQGGKEVPLA